LTEKTINDIKGGTLIKYDGKYKMFEVAQCPKDKLDQFTSIDKFKYFNTNNIWIRLESIKKLVKSNYLKDVDIIINPKKLKDGRECIQLEYAIGSMVKFFDKVKCYLVSRDRFIPVKTNNDLESVRSDNYDLDKQTWILKKVNNA
jgi:UTP--glucose-1-phosphate uridylyltransferase